MILPPNAALPPDDTGHLPLLDHTALAALLASLDQDEDALDGFVATFINHWPERLRRAAEAVATRDYAAIYDCALSIKVSSQMVGAAQLGAYGCELERVVRSGRLDDALPILESLQSIGDETVHALAAARSRQSREHAA